mmetsp:Transcript_6212/g.13008  ORF Transcript_6212/g.13008 Transcript_6212/m.13008 type:complete len:260 (-) Transcript_6212:21-800(-)
MRKAMGSPKCFRELHTVQTPSELCFRNDSKKETASMSFHHGGPPCETDQTSDGTCPQHDQGADLSHITMREEIDGYLDQLDRLKKRRNGALDLSVPRLLNEIGNVYCRNGWLSHAFESYREAAASGLSVLARQNRAEFLSLSTSTHNMAVAQYLLGEHGRAVETFALSLFLQRLHERRSPNSRAGVDVIRTVESMHDLHMKRDEIKHAKRLARYAWNIRAAVQIMSKERSDISEGTLPPLEILSDISNALGCCDVIQNK